ncbi:hypothetical protein [Pantoea allii]|uniref:hypothetical protein n=1 Tax=Pantoea allii TaxID=574096 RepID=UPI0024B80B22|nr:hypothetical protein [Pantoea allii]MDJ0039566.1 hypothetical protein [Pantoea allii]
MPLKTVIKWLHRLLTVVLLITVAAFFALNYGDNDHSKDKLISSQQLDGHTWLYVTGETGGGATVADTYRYYLAGKIQSNISANLAKQVPFLVAKGSSAAVSVEGDTISIKYSGRVYSFSNSIAYEYQGQTFRPHLDFQATD